MLSILSIAGVGWRFGASYNQGVMSIVVLNKNQYKLHKHRLNAVARRVFKQDLQRTRLSRGRMQRWANTLT